MRYDGGIRVAKFDDYQLPYSAPWGISMGEEGLMPGHGVVTNEELMRVFAAGARFLRSRGKDDEPR